MLKALFLDHDGTLVNSENLHGQLWCEVLKAHHADLMLSEYHHEYAGFSTLQNAQDFIERFQLPVGQQRLAQQKIDTTQQWLQQNAFPLIEGARELMTWAHHQGLPQAIVTGGQRWSVERTLQHYDLGRFIESITSQEDAPHNKPYPDLYLLALKRMKVSATEVLAIEDTSRGMQAALNAGIRCIVVRNEHSQTHDFTGALAVLDSLSEALAWLQAHYSDL
jgi:HAD superfamily hydrolase (TIGR01509 family)